MGMKMRGVRNSRSSAQQKAYLGADNIMSLPGVNCEIIFKAERMFIEHEGPEHHYLPVIHFVGSVLEAKGNFPFNVTTLYFNDADSKELPSDILYYPRPEELAHMIQVGRFFTDQFELPDVLSKNTYSFPAVLNLNVVPPYDTAAYEAATFSGAKLSEWENLGIDKDNLPIFYVDIVGTGVNRETDKLLDYYGIDFDSDYPVFAMTADSSGYVQPALMTYIPEPANKIVEEEQQADWYREDEMDMQEDLMESPVDEKETAPTYEEVLERSDAIPDAEAALLAERDMQIARRIEDARKKMEAEKAKRLGVPQHHVEQTVSHQMSAEQGKSRRTEQEFVAQPVREPVQTPKKVEALKPEPVAKPEEEFISDIPMDDDVSYRPELSNNDYVDEPTNIPIEDEIAVGEDVTNQTSVLSNRENGERVHSGGAGTYQGDIAALLANAKRTAQEQLAAASHQEAPVKKPEYSEVASADAFLDQPVSSEEPLKVKIAEDAVKPEKRREPDTHEQYRHVEMDFNPEANENIKKQRAEMQSDDASSVAQAAQTANKADVSDAHEQTIVDDAALTEEVQRQIRQQGRKVTDAMEDVARKAGQTGVDTELGASY